MKIIKRDGREVPYDCEKIRAAISAANDEMESEAQISDTVIGFVTGQVEKRCHVLARPVHVEEVQDMTGCSHTDPDGKAFALAVMRVLNEKCAAWRTETNISFSLYGTPMESVTYKFSQCLQRRHGIIPHVTDKNYITNSYHVHVTEPIDAFSKLTFESEFQVLSPGGAISYVEVPNMQHNIPAVLALMKHIYETILYAELNTKSDYC